MTEAGSLPNNEEEVLAEFLRAFESADDRDAVIRSYAARHPPLADEFRDLVAMNRIVDRSSDADRLPNQLGEFRIVRLVGHGGMGEVYEAVQDRLRRRVAVKTIRRGRVSYHLRARFFREQRVLAQLHQTHIVPIHTAGEEGDRHYFAMPFIDGAGLHHVIRMADQWVLSRPGSRTPDVPTLVGFATTPEPSGAPGPTDVWGSPNHTATTVQPIASGLATDGRSSIRRLSMGYFRSIARVMSDAGEALEHAHRQGILHRDVKPSNILIDQDGQ